jgi:hypothetical protein
VVSVGASLEALPSGTTPSYRASPCVFPGRLHVVVTLAALVMDRSAQPRYRDDSAPQRHHLVGPATRGDECFWTTDLCARFSLLAYRAGGLDVIHALHCSNEGGRPGHLHVGFFGRRAWHMLPLYPHRPETAA